MPTGILKLTDPRNGREYYLEWSTVVDAPVSEGMSRDDFAAYYQRRYPSAPQGEYAERMARVDTTGTSFHGETGDGVWSVLNRAGPGETFLDLVGLIDTYCKGKP